MHETYTPTQMKKIEVNLEMTLTCYVLCIVCVREREKGEEAFMHTHSHHN